MCTLTWRPAAEGYEVFFNRDELLTRAPETAPEEGEAGGLAFLAPRDGARGGTWILVNAAGVTVALLNDYGVEWRPPEPARSRGQLVLDCAAARSVAEVANLLAAAELGRTGAFSFFAVDGSGRPRVWRWNGERLAEAGEEKGDLMLSSSSYRTAEVIAERQAAYAALPERTHDVLAAYHRKHDTERGAWSVLMRRPDAATRSVIEIEVNGREVAMRYEPARWPGMAPAMVVTRRLPRV